MQFSNLKQGKKVFDFKVLKRNVTKLLSRMGQTSYPCSLQVLAIPMRRLRISSFTLKSPFEFGNSNAVRSSNFLRLKKLRFTATIFRDNSTSNTRYGRGQEKLEHESNRRHVPGCLPSLVELHLS